MRVDEPVTDLTILAHAAGRYVVAASRNVIFVYWLSQGTIDGVREIRVALERAYEESSGTSSIIHLIRDGAGLPEPDVRTAVLEMSSSFGSQTAVMGIVLMGAGFWASALQSILTALRMLAPERSGLMRFSRGPGELCEWFPAEHERRTGELVEPEELMAKLESILATGDLPGTSPLVSSDLRSPWKRP